MVQNKKIGAALTLAAGLLSLGASGTASALPEMDVGTVPPFMSPLPPNTVDSAVTAPENEDEDEDEDEDEQDIAS